MSNKKCLVAQTAFQSKHINVQTFITFIQQWNCLVKQQHQNI